MWRLGVGYDYLRPMTTAPRSPLPAPSGDVELLERLAAARADLLGQVGRRIVGQHGVLDGILTAIFSGGHALLVGVPGLAKTLMVQTVAEALDLQFSRIQFTPDLMPSDITGTEIIEEDVATGKRGFRFVRGPVFANIVLADEVNRTPPMTQAPEESSLPFIKEYISWGAGPRASQYLVLGAKARAALDGRPMADEDDLRVVAPTVLTHRIVINFAAEAAGRTAADIISQL